MRDLAQTISAERGRSIELDFVRGVAIIMVMGMHFHTVTTGYPLLAVIEYPFKQYGREGVNLFFALSGFLVGGLLLRQYAQGGQVDAGLFIIRRIFKIWPAYYALILFHVLVGRHPPGTFLYQNLTHLQNYLGSSIAQTWSLAVEEHFYLLLPALLLLLGRWRASARAILWTLGALCAAVLAARCAVVAAGDLHAAAFYTQYRIDSLLIGVMLATVYWMLPDVYRRLARNKPLLLALVLGLVVWLGWLQKALGAEESVGYTIQAIGFVALIVLMLEYSAALRNARLYRAVAWTGVYSYGIYLWHSLALAPGDFFIRKALAFGVPVPLVWVAALVLQFGLAAGIGFLTTRAIEFPCLRLRDALFPPRQRRVPDADAGAVEGAAALPGKRPAA
ncbi:acyltransferase (plasmid) [Cupriavidus necator]|uniref:Acyltransferase n=1 Tax=Cupriavidus necator TaxID=106590 RepID=A0A367P7N8_CUPNE|nr:acyltransferase [Cupriavidus necator]QQX89572.1 acyltransferase [Cupriavidus necator]RCJ03849.1 acyltransferase [Cupriavidus necator]